MYERGFKTWSENYSVDSRKNLGLDASAPLDPIQLAGYLGIRVWTPNDVPGLSDEALSVLLRNDGKTASCWSAVTIVLGCKIVIVLNSSHSRARQASDLTHELAHRIRGHTASEVAVSEDGLMLLDDYDKTQEAEADWLASCLLLPRAALVQIRRRGIDDSAAATEYGVSLRMLQYRLSMTGVNRQFA